MKTKIQYPGGLAITIEYEEQLVPQLLEVKECELSDDTTRQIEELIGKNESLRRTVSEFETVVSKLENENTELRDVLKTLRLENFDQGATIDSLKEEIQKLSAMPGPIIPTKAEKVEKSKKKTAAVPSEKANPKWSRKPCANCGHLFQPTGPRSSVCPDCKAAGEIFAAGENFTENPE